MMGSSGSNDQHSSLASDVVVSVRNVSKKFCKNLRRSMAYGIKDLAQNLVGISPDTTDLRKDEFWAVRNISFDLRRGEALGLIGKNGSGKSTLLRLMAGIFPPDKGEIAFRGRVGALISLGAGFHPHMTGRENIYINGTILGMTRAELTSKFQDIVDFSEIGDFLDAPVSTYSSGMRVRLGFAIAIHLDPDLLLIDEVLAVGDVGFRAKCYNAMAELASRAAVIFVSHSMVHVSRLTNIALVLHNGRKHYLGQTGRAILEYYKLYEMHKPAVRAGNGAVRVKNLKVLDDSGCESASFKSGGCFQVKMVIKAVQAIPSLTADLTFSTVGEEIVAECNNYIYRYPISMKTNEQITLDIIISKLTLNPGRYRMSVLLLSGDMVSHYDWIRDVLVFEVLGDRVATAAQQFCGEWHVTR